MDRYIREGAVCDGRDDCRNGDDEKHLLCEKWRCPGARPWRCPRSGACLAAGRLCDGEDDCGDADDEAAELCGVDHECRLDGVDYSGGTMQQLGGVGSLEGCRAWCRNTTGCVAVSWGKAGTFQHQCNLKNNTHRKASRYQDAISAKLSCFCNEAVGLSGGLLAISTLLLAFYT